MKYGIFNDILVARAPKIKDRLLKMLLSLVHKERTGEPINRGLLKNITQMLIDLGINRFVLSFIYSLLQISRSVYEEDFEKPFLDQSATFYKVESQEFITSNSCADYMRKVEARIKEELERVTHYLDASTEPKIKEVVERELISAHMKTLIEVLFILFIYLLF